MRVALEGLPATAANAVDAVHRINGRVRAIAEARYDIVDGRRADVVLAGGLYGGNATGDSSAPPRCVLPHGALGDPGHWMTSIPRLRRGDLLAVSSTSDERIAAAMGGGDDSFCRVERLPLFVDGDVFRPLVDARDRASLRRELGLPETAPLLLAVARPIPEKNLHGAIELAAAVRERVPNVELAVAGGLPARGTDYGDYIADLLVRRGVAVHDAGVLPPAALNRLYNACEALVHLTLVRKENFGLVTVEAQAAGLPVLCAHWGGCQDTVEPGVTGYYAPTFLTGGQRRVDWRSLVEPCAALLQAPERRARMGDAGRRRVEALYTEDAFAARLDELVARTAEGSPDATEPVTLSDRGQQTVVTYAMVARDHPELPDSAAVSRLLYREQYGVCAYRPIHEAMATRDAPPRPGPDDLVYRALDVEPEAPAWRVRDPIWAPLETLEPLEPGDSAALAALDTPMRFDDWRRAAGDDVAERLLARGIVANVSRALGA